MPDGAEPALSAPPRQGGLIRNPQDFWGGVGLVAIGAVALWASSDLPGMRGIAFGPGTAPRLFSTLLVLLGGLVAVQGCLTEGPALERYAVRGPTFVIGSIIVFAATIRPLGLVISTFATLMVASAGTRDVRWRESIVVSAALTAFCAILFPYVLNLPMQLWPNWLRF
jgi:putative tricarboxylic transport membrane protein